MERLIWISDFSMIDRLSSFDQGTYGTSDLDQRFFHDLRLILEAGDIDAWTQEDTRSLRRAWNRLTAADIPQYSTAREASHSDAERPTVRTALVSKPDHALSKRGKFKRRLSALVAFIVFSVLLAGTVAIFALAPYHRSVHQQRATTNTGSAPTRIKLGTTIYIFQQPDTGIYALQWSPDSTRIVSTGGNVYSWSAFNGSHKVHYAAPPRGSALLFVQLSPDGKTLAIWNVSEIDLYNAATGKPFETLTYPFLAKGYPAHFGPYVSWSPDGKLLRILVQLPTVKGLLNKIETYNIATRARQELDLNLSEQPDQVAWSPNGKYMAIDQPSEGAVSVIDLATGEIVSSLYVGASPIKTIEINWSPDSKQLVSSFGGGLRVWDAATATTRVVIYQNGMEPVWSPNSKYIAIADGSLIKILDASNGHLLYTYTGQKGEVYAIAWSPNSAFIASEGSVDGLSIVNVWAARP